MRKLSGVHAPHLKKTADCTPEKIPVPAEIVLPMSMHIGAPSKPAVKAGDEVKVGQLVAEASGFVSSPVYASVSGKVKSVDTFEGANGARTTAVVIASDGLQTPCEALQPPVVTNMDEFLNAVRDSGSVGLGGAGFPTAAKLKVNDPSKIEYIIINGAECEPYITSDTRTMTDDADLVYEGALLLKKHMGVKNLIIAIEDNKPAPIKKMRDLTASDGLIEVWTLPALYPQGGEKVLIYNITGRAVPEGKLPLDVGVIVLNCTTVAVIARYIKTGMPLVSKCVTVDGSAVKEPKNVIAPIGTPVKALFDYCGGFKEEPKKVLYGGPMMGIAIHDLNLPVLKNTNAVLAFNEKDAKLPEETACIRCGRCVSRCPLQLMPYAIETAYKLKKPELLDKYKVNLCMECGCCAYTCPAKRRLVQVMKLSKAMLRDYQAAKKAEEEKKAAKKEAGSK
jgi:electron transport complex protein RnfC